MLFKPPIQARLSLILSFTAGCRPWSRWKLRQHGATSDRPPAGSL